jgi:uncharacterized Zn finger protein
MCKHVAAVFYGVGARLDQKPELLFLLRAVDAAELVAGVDHALTVSKSRPKPNKVLAAGDMAALFGLDMAEAEPPDRPLDKPERPKIRPGKDKAAAPPKRSTSAAQAVPKRAVVVGEGITRFWLSPPSRNCSRCPGRRLMVSKTPPRISRPRGHLPRECQDQL